MSTLVGCENDECTLNIHDETERCKMCKFLIGDRVRLEHDAALTGVIINVRDGKEYGGPIFTIRLDTLETPDGLYVARACELEYLP